MKCPNCGTENEDGMKFCGECGVELKYSKNIDGGVNMGDKNVVAGDVIGSEYKISGNATFVKNEDERHKVLLCSVCGKHLVNAEAITCPKCGKTVCAEHFNKKQNECVSCVKQNVSNNEQTYIDALNKAYADDRIDIDERKALNALKAKLGLSDEKADELEKMVAASHKAELSGLSRRDQYSLLQAKKALYEEFDWQAAYNIAQELYKENPDNEEILDLYLYSLSCTDVEGDELVQFVDSLKADFATAYYVKIKKLKGNEKEALIAEARKKFPDDFRIAAREIVDIANFAVAAGDATAMAEAKEKTEAVKEPASEMDKAIYKSYIYFINALLETKDSARAKKLCAEYYKARKNEKYALFAYSFIDTEKAKEEFFAKKQGEGDAKTAIANAVRKEEKPVLKTSAVANAGLTRNEVYEFEKAKKLLLEEYKGADAVKVLKPLYEKYGSGNLEIASLYIRALKDVDAKKTRQVISSLNADIAEAAIANIDFALDEDDLNNAEKLLNEAKRRFPDDIVVKCKEIEYLLAFYKKFGDKNIVQEVGALAKALPFSKDGYERAAVDFARAISARVAGDEAAYQAASEKYSIGSGNVSLFMARHHKKLGEIKCSHCGKWELPYYSQLLEVHYPFCKSCGNEESESEIKKQKGRVFLGIIITIAIVVGNFLFFRFSHTNYMAVRDSFPWWKYLILCFALPVSLWTSIASAIFYREGGVGETICLAVLLFVLIIIGLFILGWIILPFKIGTTVLSIVYDIAFALLMLFCLFS